CGRDVFGSGLDYW
nr:immunoglobulin heavy chain junction region [Macaca mulatta]MOX92175.1 immunoglobulin heavy chain junction region [Macaca mulatta]MOX95413.1 immunoglobulin heavy chain junction region [Macaca mulatta]